MLGVLALLGAVAVAATGSTPGGSGETRRPANVLVDTMFSLLLVVFAIGAVLLVYGLTQRKAIAQEFASGRYRRIGALPVLLFIGLFTAVAYYRLRSEHLGLNGGQTGGSRSPGDASVTNKGAVENYHAHFAWIPVTVIVLLAAAALLAWQVSVRRRRAAERGAELVAESLSAAIEAGLDDLRAEDDPRRAVIAAYARMERALAAFGLPRRRPETQEEYMARILVDLEVEPRAVRRLTDLFTRAKFSRRDVDAEMKEEAIATLEHVRDELRAVEERRRRALEDALPAISARA